MGIIGLLSVNISNVSSLSLDIGIVLYLVKWDTLDMYFLSVCVCVWWYVCEGDNDCILVQPYLLNAFMSVCIVCACVYVCVFRGVCSSHLVSLCTWEICFLLPWTTCDVLQAL